MINQQDRQRKLIFLDFTFGIACVNTSRHRDCSANLRNSRKTCEYWLPAPIPEYYLADVGLAGDDDIYPRATIEKGINL